ncbi:MAG TPA: DUF6542 domain-containing protein [Pseudonocardia sp.]|nr:DUF6542 domain-containing protein [Pseudonocardia sp.]
MSERLSDAADSAEPAPSRQASGDGAPPPAADEPAAADDAPAQSPSATGTRAQSPPAGGAPAQTPPANTTRAQSPPAGGPSQRSALSDKARAVSPGTRPRRTAADRAREAAGKSATGAGEDAGQRDDVAGERGAPNRRDSSTRAGDRMGSEERASAGARGGRDGSSADQHGKRGSGEKGASDVGPERERPSGPWPMPDRSLMATVLGVNPAIAVGVAAALTAVGVAIDLLRVGTLGTAFTICYLTGCVLATAWVRRSGVFWPMVAPPLLMALAVPVVVLVAGTPRPGAGIAQRLLVIGAPLVNGFPMMAWTSGLVLALGLFRLVTQREHPGRGAARAGGRTSASPRRS